MAESQFIDPFITTRVNPRVLAGYFANTTPRWWKKWMPALVQQGIVHKRGGLRFAKLARIEDWLLSDGHTKGRRKS